MPGRRTSLALGVASLVLAGCSYVGGQLAPITPPPPPSEAAALAHLAAIVDAVEAGDLDLMCRIGGSNCPEILRDADRAAVPEAPPVLLGVRLVPSQRQANGSWTSGGQLLDLCGIDGRGRTYESQMLIFDEGDGTLRSINTLYWLGARVATGPEVVGTLGPPDRERCPDGASPGAP